MPPDEYGDSCRRIQKTALSASPPALLPEIAALPPSRHMQGCASLRSAAAQSTLAQDLGTTMLGQAKGLSSPVSSCF